MEFLFSYIRHIKYLLKVFILFDLGPETRPHVIMKTWDFENFESPPSSNAGQFLLWGHFKVIWRVTDGGNPR